MGREVSSKKHEILGVLVLLVAALLLICLVSYDSQDPSFNALSYRVGTANWAGRIGAYVSDFLLQVFGYSSFLLLIPLFVFGWNLIRGRGINLPVLRTVGLIILTTASCTSFHILPLRLQETNFMPGGMVGAILANFLLPNLNIAGTVIILIGALILGILASTTFTLQNFFNRGPADRTKKEGGFWTLRRCGIDLYCGLGGGFFHGSTLNP